MEGLLSTGPTPSSFLCLSSKKIEISKLNNSQGSGIMIKNINRQTCLIPMCLKFVRNNLIYFSQGYLNLYSLSVWSESYAGEGSSKL